MHLHRETQNPTLAWLASQSKIFPGTPLGEEEAAQRGPGLISPPAVCGVLSLALSAGAAQGAVVLCLSAMVAGTWSI